MFNQSLQYDLGGEGGERRGLKTSKIWRKTVPIFDYLYMTEIHLSLFYVFRLSLDTGVSVQVIKNSIRSESNCQATIEDYGTVTFKW